MISEIFKITDDSEVSLTSYISDISEEMKNMKKIKEILLNYVKIKSIHFLKDIEEDRR